MSTFPAQVVERPSTETQSQSTTEETRPSTGKPSRAAVRFDQITEPGCYICNGSGHLLRVPQNAITPGSPPLLDVGGDTPTYVTKICDNPFVPKTKARLLAAAQDIDINADP